MLTQYEVLKRDSRENYSRHKRTECTKDVLTLPEARTEMDTIKRIHYPNSSTRALTF
jgi:hypothetical protein